MSLPGGKMACPGNGIYVIQGEMSVLLTAMKKVNRWSSHVHQDDENDILIRSFTDLKDVLNQIGDLREVEPNHFLSPFLEVIRSEETTGPVTSLALSSVNKFLSYGLIDSKSKTIAATVENIAEAVTRARFVGTDQTNDSIVLLKILQVLRTLLLSPEGCWLTNESVLEILLSCFRMCFEPRLNELLRRCAENCLRDMVQLLFSRLPSFTEDNRKIQQKLKMNTSAPLDSGKGKKKTSRPSSRKVSRKSQDKSPSPVFGSEVSNALKECDIQQLPLPDEPPITSHDKLEPEILTVPTEESLAKIPSNGSLEINSVNNVSNVNNLEEHQNATSSAILDDGVIISIEDSSSQNSESTEQLATIGNLSEVKRPDDLDVNPSETNFASPLDSKAEEEPLISPTTPESPVEGQDWTNQQGVRFTNTESDTTAPSGPYGLLSAHELLRFLASLCNPLDKQNSDSMIHIGLTLITVALEVGADSIAKFPSLLSTVKNDVCRSLLALLNTEKLPIFASVLQVSFLLFESLRTHLKFQLERYLSRLTEIIISDSSKISYEHREIALESVVHLWRIPGLVTELYLNYDCALYCPNLYEELTNLLSKNAFPVTGVYNTHLLSLDALLTVIDSIESHCNSRILNERQNPSKDGEINKLEFHDFASNYIHRTGTRQKLSLNIPSHEQLMAVKRKKKLLATGTEHFNSKPKKGIQFLQEHNLLSTPLDAVEVVGFLRENPHLDKKMIGEYISNRANIAILDQFVKSFDFTEMRIDEALRLYLETFRLPGESPLISLVMEHFAEHWHKCNGEPFANADAAFTLAYAIIMLNVDQHNHNVKKQNTPMSSDAFKRNLKNVNGGQDFEEEMLDEIYIAIKTEEIVMPAEQTGLVKENYEWKVLLRRGTGPEGCYVHAPNGLLDHDLFSLIWSPTISALSYLFDKTNDPTIYQKAISGFRKCAMISAHYGMSNDFDNLIVSLCKYTMLHYSAESPENLTISFGSSPKARRAAKTVFDLAHRHGDIIRESWRNILDCILQLYRCKLLPKILVEAEDFIELSGKISLIREDIQLSPKTETGILSSLYSYIALGAETNTQKGPSVEDQEAIKVAQNCIRECHLEQLITESKFLRIDSLQHFVKALVTASYGPEGHVSLGTSYSEDTAVFFLELLLKVVIQNRDRISSIWCSVKEHIYTLLMGAAACDHHFLVERSVVGLLRLAIRLMHKEEMGPMVLQSLRMLLLLKSSTLSRVSRQVSYGTFELLKTSAANIHSATDWAIIFTLLECVGAGAPPPKVVSKPVSSTESAGARSEGEVQVDSGLGNERGYTSDSELSKAGSVPLSPSLSPEAPLSNTPTGWILVGREGEIQPVSCVRRTMLPELSRYDPLSMVKCVDSLSFLVRDVVHITPYNFHDCIRCIRTFVEAAANTVERKSRKSGRDTARQAKRKSTKRREERGLSPTGSAYDADESDPEDSPGYQQVCIQLLELMHTLHTRTAQIFRWWAEETGQKEVANPSYWTPGWCPLLQGISRLCSHPNRAVRMSAITYLQRALLMQDLQSLSGEEWEECFTQVLFPLLSTLLSVNIPAIEETRIRAATVLSKVFLHHLSPLQTLPSFAQLWLTILDYMDKYMHADNSDLLYEAIPESLKNLLLVMDSAGVFNGLDGRNEIWVVTWDRISSFLPNLQADLFKDHLPVVDASSLETKEALETSKSETEVVQTEQPTLQRPPGSQQSSPLPPLMPKPGEAVEISGPTTNNNVGSQNWQPPAPVYPHLEQMVSTPIGPASHLPVYSGFASMPHQPPPPSAQFFYQDMSSSSPPNMIQSSEQPAAGSSLLLASAGMEPPKLPVISPPTSS
ncbi:unnamed protein product [Nezara viridula]|uniref:SEC7 domain-containing protein n=1 Tax=Nezara viridula TaxID=85310 RepID=A0A9P0HP99_NEZVI|nr:unnamed protein product [Nezara viridula]